jgi:hypothetical protein
MRLFALTFATVVALASAAPRRGDPLVRIQLP